MLRTTLALLLALAPACGSSTERPDASADTSIGLDARPGDGSLDARPDAPDDAAPDAAPADCEGLNEPDCAGRDGCVPMYDDRCCPSCEPGPCADCTDVRFHSCVPMGACAADACGTFSSFWCSGISPVCPDRFESPNDCLATEACVTAIDPTCTSDCRMDCAPVFPDICDPATCDDIPPACPTGQRPVVRDGCYSGLCIPEDVCEVPTGG